MTPRWVLPLRKRCGRRLRLPRSQARPRALFLSAAQAPAGACPDFLSLRTAAQLLHHNEATFLFVSSYPAAGFVPWFPHGPPFTRPPLRATNLSPLLRTDTNNATRHQHHLSGISRQDEEAEEQEHDDPDVAAGAAEDEDEDDPGAGEYISMHSCT